MCYDVISDYRKKQESSLERIIDGTIIHKKGLIMENKIIGMIIGAATGDALGAPLAFMSHQQIEIKHGTVKEMIGGGWLHLRPGGWTDATAQMLCLLDSILEKKDFDQQDAAGRYVAWMRKKPVDIGNTSRASLSLIDDGRPIEAAAREAHEGAEDGSADNGTVMRCAPLAGLFVNDPSMLMKAAMLDARITHWDIKTASCSALLCLVLRSLLQGNLKEDSFRTADEILMENDLDLYNPVPDVSFLTEKDITPGVAAVDTLTCAFRRFKEGKNFEDMLVRTVNMGGESDTIGAVAGALGGARWGIEKIPERWWKLLQDHGLIMQKAKKLAQCAAEKA